MPNKQKTLFLHIIPSGILSVSLVLFLNSVAVVHAHKIYVFARVEGDLILTESYFSDERKVKNGVIRVYDSSGEQLLKGKTDEKGAFSFKIPQQTDLRIVLEASMGHRAEYVLKADELTGKATIRRQKERSPGLLEIGEGVGIILGLAGLLIYLNYRKKRLMLKKENGK